MTKRVKRKMLLRGVYPPCWFSRIDWNDSFPDPYLPHLARSIPDVDWKRQSNNIKWPFAFWNFYLSKGTRVGHIFLTRLVICLHSTSSGNLWFLLKKKNASLTKESAWFTLTKLRRRQESERLCWKNRLLLKSIFSVLLSESWWKWCCFEHNAICAYWNLDLKTDLITFAVWKQFT